MGDIVILLTSIMAAFGTICLGFIFWAVSTASQAEWCECTKCGDKHPIEDFDVEDGASR